MLKHIHVPGDTFGRLTLIGEVPKDPNSTVKWHHRRRRFKFKCRCGSEVITAWGSAESCGCLQREAALRAGHGRRKPVGEAAFNAVYVGYVNSATKKGIEFRLTRDEAHKLTSADCFYCGWPPSVVRQLTTRKRNGDYPHNGIDRVDSSLGYTVDNTVPCCLACNQAKNSRSQQDFYAWVKRIHAHLLERGVL